MNFLIDDTYDALSSRAADNLVHSLKSLKTPLICTASGDSPVGLYKRLVEKGAKNELDVSNWLFVGLDEWVGLNGNDEGSCRYHLDRQLFHPLKISEEKICFFDGRASDLQAECTRTEGFINQHKGIDVAILGLGMNGHIGMNEPGTSASTRSHLADLAPTTKQVGQKYFQKRQQLSRGITLGLANLLEARIIMLLINGSHKAEIAQRVVEEKVSEALPASLLRNHPALYIYIDSPAARLIDAKSFH